MDKLLQEFIELKKQIQNLSHYNKDYLTIEETSLYLGLSKSALYKKRGSGAFNFYQPGGKLIYFKKSELIEWIEKGKVTTAEDLLRQSTNYLNS